MSALDVSPQNELRERIARAVQKAATGSEAGWANSEYAADAALVEIDKEFAVIKRGQWERVRAVCIKARSSTRCGILSTDLEPGDLDELRDLE